MSKPFAAPAWWAPILAACVAAPALAAPGSLPGLADDSVVFGTTTVTALRRMPALEQRKLVDAALLTDPQGLARTYRSKAGAQDVMDTVAIVKSIGEERAARLASIVADGVTQGVRWDIELALLTDLQLAHADNDSTTAVRLQTPEDGERLFGMLTEPIAALKRAHPAERVWRGDALTPEGASLVAGAIAEASEAIDRGASGATLVDAHVARAGAWALEGDMDKAFADLARAGEADPHRSRVFVFAGRLRAEMAQWADAKKAFDRAIDIAPKSAEVLARRALVESRLDDRAASLADGARAVDLDPANAFVRQYDGLVLAYFDENVKAVEQYDQAIRLAPGDPFSWMDRGIAKARSGDHAGALADYTHAIDEKLVPEVLAIWKERAAEESSLEHYDAEIADLTHVIDRDAASHITTTDIVEYAHLWRGSAFYVTGDPVRAAADWRAAISLKPDDAVALKFLAVTLEGSHDYAEAADYYGRSLSVEQNDAVASSLARMQLFSGRFAEAAVSFRANVAQSGQNGYPPLWLYVARVRADVADEAAARTELAKNKPPGDAPRWIDSLVDFLRGRIDAAALRDAAAAGPFDKLPHQCEADYYTAEMLIAHRNASAAKPLLDEVVQICPPKFFEARGAVAELALQHALGGFQ